MCQHKWVYLHHKENRPLALAYLANVSADKTLPITLPKCGTLFTYGSALVIRIFRSPSLGRIFLTFVMVSVCVRGVNFEDSRAEYEQWR